MRNAAVTFGFGVIFGCLKDRSPGHGKTKLICGVIVLLTGLSSLGILHYMRPPQSAEEIAWLETAGRGYIQEPLYQFFLVIAAFISVFGAALGLMGWRALEPNEEEHSAKD